MYTLVMSDQGNLWDAQWTQLAAFGRIMLVVLWPLTLGAGAWQARRDRRGKMEELLGTVPRPTWRRGLPTSAALAIGVASGYVVMVAAGAVRVFGSTGYWHLGWLAIAAVGALSLVAAAWLGMGIGRLAPSAYTPPVVVVGGFLLLLVPVELSKTAPATGISLLSPNLTSTIDEFTTFAGSVTLAQAVWFFGLALGGLALVLVARRRLALLAVAPVALGLVVALPLLGAAPAGGLEPDRAALASVCTSSAPVVCVTRAHADGLPALVGPAREALALLAKLPNAPKSVHEVTGSGGVQPADQVWFHSDNYRPGSGWLSDVTVRILAGAGTRPCDPIDYRTRAIAAAWLYGQYPAPGLEVEPGEEATARDAEWRALTELPLDQQVRWVTEIREAGLTC